MTGSSAPSRRAVISAATSTLVGLAAGPARANSQGPVSPAMQAVLDYVQSQKTTGFLVMQDRKLRVERNWPVSEGAAPFRAFTYGTGAGGGLLEDVASQQKSFVAVLAAIAIDKGFLDIAKPASAYLGKGWSKATPEQEDAITVLNLMSMNSGLDEKFTYLAPPGTTFFYNTPVYAAMKPVVAAAAHLPIETVTQDWLTGPLAMPDTSWRKRPGAFADVGNPTGLVTSPRDVATFGQMVLDEGVAANGRRIVSQSQLAALFQRSPTNPAYGRLWWLNGSAFAIKPLARRVEGPMIPAAPSDLVAALGALDRKLYVVPSHRLIVVRMGQAAPDKDFDQQLWLRLTAALAGA